MKTLILFFLSVAFILLNAQGDDTLISQLTTFGTAGKQLKPLSSEKEAELFNYTGKGCLTHMWFGGAWKEDYRTRIRIYVDDEIAPSIDMELLLGTGVGFGDQSAPWGSAKMDKNAGGANMYNTFHIPFGKSVRVTGQLAPGADPSPTIWWEIGGVDNLRVQLDGYQLPDTARLKLYKLENYTAKPLEEFPLCDVPGAGALYLVTIAAQGSIHTGGSSDWAFMDGCMRAYYNGAREASLLSSGFEDYFLGAGYFCTGRFANDISGVTHLNAEKAQVSAYRFHDTDPIFFKNGFKLTARCGEQINGQTISTPSPTTYTTYTWLYQW